MTPFQKQEEIKCLAESIAENYWGEGGYLNIEKILQAKGIDLYEDNFGSEFDGVLEYADKQFSIFLNNNLGNSCDSLRGRFTLGHELGHFFIDEHRRPMEKGKLNPHPSKVLKSDIPMEHEADWFSCNLLMPESYFRKAARKQNGFQGVINLSQQFKTSWTATAIRYLRLMCPGAALIFWENQSPSWCLTAEDYYLSLYKGRTAEKPPRGSATEKLFKDGEVGDIEKQGTVLSEWKPRIKSWCIHNEILLEEALCIGSYGVLTMLTVDTSLGIS